MHEKLQQLAHALDGDLHHDKLLRTLYATDASAYQEMPLAVAIPKTHKDIRELIVFASDNNTSLIPRAAGTSLAGQVVGQGIVVDISRHFTRILEINKEEGCAIVEPGVIRNELNMALKPHGILFGPETSTQNRCMIGGMLGNNSCGSNSIVYGSTREHTISVKGFLSDGSQTEFKALTKEEFEAKCDGDPTLLETKIYRRLREILSDPENRAEIEKEFPKKSIPRRNTGYALDLLMDADVFDPSSDKPFNLCKLIAGSEGTLFFATEIKVNCPKLPPKGEALLCGHFNTIPESLLANTIAVQHGVFGSELMDHFILECTKDNLAHRRNRFFVEGDPTAILVVDFRDTDDEKAIARAEKLKDQWQAAGLGYAYPVVIGADIKRVWDLRKAGLGLMSNIPGDAKPVALIEDTAVDVEDLPAYIDRLDQHLKDAYGLECVHYAHAGTGELHMRPIINLKTQEGKELFRKVAVDVAKLVKEYGGSLSGEHGDGRLRGEFLKDMIGEKNYQLVYSVKELFDPKHIFNPNKIVDTPPMNESLRYTPGQKTPEFDTFLDFSKAKGILRMAELCNGTADCRKTHLTGGTMCPSYMATRDEKDTTRARANVLRDVLTNSTKENPFDSQEIKDVMDLCLSCKGCKSECPSSVDVGKMKAEFLQHYYDANGVPLRTLMIGNYTKSSTLASYAPWAWNFIFTTEPLAKIAKKMSGFATDRSIPLMHKTTLRKWFAKHTPHANAGSKGAVLLFCDEFTNFNDVPIGIKTVELLERLGYSVEIPEHKESARTWLSKGLLRKAKKIANDNIRLLESKVSEEKPLLGIEPSGILGFRDEYPELAEPQLKDKAKRLADNALLVEEFLMRQLNAGKLSSDEFCDEKRLIKLHGHCHQKAHDALVPTVRILQLPKNFTVEVIASGCCGMAGSFGYEKEHYEVSMKVGELVLFPAVREQSEDVLIVAPGTSCRHQIKDGTTRKALHPVEVLHAALV